jgi:hypothetical protein
LCSTVSVLFSVSRYSEELKTGIHKKSQVPLPGKADWVLKERLN